MEDLLIQFLKSGDVLESLDKFTKWYQREEKYLRINQVTTLPAILELYFKSDVCDLSGWLYDCNN